MDPEQRKVLGVVLTILIFQVLSTSQISEELFLRQSTVDTDPAVRENAVQEMSSKNEGEIHRKRRSPLLGKLILAGGAGLFAKHEIKKYKPCTGYHVGITANGKMKRTMRANKRCQKMYDKVKDGIQSKCPNVMKAECTKVPGHDHAKCAVFSGNGQVTELTNCV